MNRVVELLLKSTWKVQDDYYITADGKIKFSFYNYSRSKPTLYAMINNVGKETNIENQEYNMLLEKGKHLKETLSKEEHETELANLLERNM